MRSLYRRVRDRRLICSHGGGFGVAKVNGSEVNVFLQFCMQRQKLTLLALYPFFFSPFFLINFM
jgi:hypothetical protein